MNNTIKALPNQSLLDITIMQYGSLEAGMQFALANDIGISTLPGTGNEFIVSGVDAAATDKAVRSYLQQNGIVIGTKGPIPPLDMEIVLKPVMHIVPNVVGNPHTIGYYSYDLLATPGFINANELVSSYLSANKVNFQTEERYVLGYPPEITVEDHSIPMPEKKVSYKPHWTEGLGYMMVWSDPALLVKTVTFKDITGNEAYVSPTVVLDNISQNVMAYLVADLSLEVVTSSPGLATIRITRSHAPIGLADFSHHTMEWLDDAVGGTPDPDDPADPDKRILVLAAGNYTLGVKTSYEYVGVTVYPSSAFTMVINVA